MSRTYRRKGKAPKWVTHDWVYNDSILFMSVRQPLEGIELKKAVSEWHRDSMWIQYGPDAEFRKIFGHKFDRQQERRALTKEFYALEKGNEFFYKARNIGWLWW